MSVPHEHDDFSIPVHEDAYQAFLAQLVEARLLIPLGVRGLYGRGGEFERVIEHFDALVMQASSELKPEVVRFPPIFSRKDYEKIGHINNFPDLMGSVHTFKGNEREHREMLGRFERGEDWSRDLAPAQVMMAPASCYPLYPTAAGTTLPIGGRRVDIQGFVFRHEPSDDPARMQAFRMHEQVRLGTPDEALDHRNYWLERAREIYLSVGLEVEQVVANDPFFGRGGKVQKAIQLEQVLKYELVIPICSVEKPTAISSSNLHLDHFGAAFDIKSHDGKTAHSACFGFGLERTALALFKTHGLDCSAWPAAVRNVLALG